MIKSSISLILDLNNLKFIAYQVENADKDLWNFLPSQRGAPLLIHSNYLYRCERKINNRLYWLCINYKKSKCNARVILEGNVLCKSTEHNHLADSRSNDVSKIRSKNLEDDDVDEWLKSNAWNSNSSFSKIY